MKIENLENFPVERKIKLAEDINTSPEILKELSSDKHWRVRFCVAGNINTPVETLIALSQDEYWGVRSNIAKNSSTPVRILSILSADTNDYVREDVAKNPNTPVKVLADLTKDVSWIRRAITLNPNAPTNVLSTLAKDREWIIRWQVAKHVNTSSKDLKKFTYDSDPDIQNAAYKNLESRKSIDDKLFSASLKSHIQLKNNSKTKSKEPRNFSIR